VDFQVAGGTVRALDGISIHVNPGETVAVSANPAAVKRHLLGRFLVFNRSLAGRSS